MIKLSSSLSRLFNKQFTNNPSRKADMKITRNFLRPAQHLSKMTTLQPFLEINLVQLSEQLFLRALPKDSLRIVKYNFS